MMIFFANMCSKVSFGRNKSTNTSDFENHTLKTHIEGSAIANSDSSPLAKFNSLNHLFCFIIPVAYAPQPGARSFSQNFGIESSRSQVKRP